MRQRELKRMLAMVANLTPSQRRMVKDELSAGDQVSAVADIVDTPATKQVCPHCQGDRIVRNGTASGLQRYKCHGCHRTFNALTGSPLARLRQKGKWLAQADALYEGITITRAANRLKVARSTAFRWRHRFMMTPKTIQAQVLVGIAEADETFFLRSNKGQRCLGRPSRRRGGKATQRGLSKEQVPVLVARDRSGATATPILAADGKADLVKALKPLLPADTLLCTDGSPVLAAVAKELGVDHHPINVSAGQRVVEGVFHIQNVNSFDSRLKTWIRRFNGVATKYLDSYLGWFRTLDRTGPSGWNPSAFLALAAKNYHVTN